MQWTPITVTPVPGFRKDCPLEEDNTIYYYQINRWKGVYVSLGLTQRNYPYLNYTWEFFVSYFVFLFLILGFCFVLFQAFVCIWLSVGGFPLNPLHSSSFAPPPEHYFLSLLLSGPRDTASNWLFICRRMKPIWLDPTLNRNKFLRIKDFIVRAEPQKLIEEGGEHKST